MAAAAVTPQVQPVSDSSKLWGAALCLTCDLRIELHAPGFTVRDLLQLAPNSLVATNCKQGSTVALTVNGQVLASTEFEVLGDKLGIRLTELL